MNLFPAIRWWFMASLGRAKIVLPAYSLFIIRKIIDDVFHFLKFGLREWVTVWFRWLRAEFFLYERQTIHLPTGYTHRKTKSKLLGHWYVCIGVILCILRTQNYVGDRSLAVDFRRKICIFQPNNVFSDIPHSFVLGLYMVWKKQI